MNKQLQAELTKIITNINTGAETAWGFINEQTPEVVQQLLMWHGVKSFLDMTLPFLCFILFLSIFCITIKKTIEAADQNEFCIEVPFTIGSAISGLLFGIGTACNFNLTWLQIWIAPKVWLLEYIAKMVK